MCSFQYKSFIAPFFLPAETSLQRREHQQGLQESHAFGGVWNGVGLVFCNPMVACCLDSVGMLTTGYCF